MKINFILPLFTLSSLQHFCNLLLFTMPVASIWNKFDLVRQRIGAWGSSQHTPFIKINRLHNNGPIVNDSSSFGYSVANIGDLNGDGIEDIAVGAIGESILYNGNNQIKAGGIYVLFMSRSGTVTSYTHINGIKNGGPIPITGDEYGHSLAGIGDLDGDGINDIAVGAPGTVLSSVYLLYMWRNGTVRDYILVRGAFEYIKYNKTSSSNNVHGANLSYVPNGPPISYGSRFGSSIANIGDFNHDGVNDIAVGAGDLASTNFVYILFMQRNGSVSNYTTIGVNGVGGGPSTTTGFVRFGSSIVAVGDLNHDNVTDLAIGASDFRDAGSLLFKTGAVFICFMNASGHVHKSERISERGNLVSGKNDIQLPVQAFDQCGASVASIGDINLDNMQQHHPTRLKSPSRESIPDVVMGCPQSGTGYYSGRLFLDFLSKVGDLGEYRVIPSDTDTPALGGPDLKALDAFGQGMSGYYDVDGNGIREIIVGAPGDSEGNHTQSGAIYIIFMRRRRFHQPIKNLVSFFLLVTLLPCFCCVCSVSSIGYFLWRYRRRPDLAEKIVIESGLKITEKRSRPKYKKKSNHVYTDAYTV